MHEWIKKNNEKVIYGLALLVVLLLIWGFSTLNARIKLTQETEQLNNDKTALSLDAAAKDQMLRDANSRIDDLSKSNDESLAEVGKLTAEIAALTAANGELTEKAASLEAELAEAKVEIDRLDFAGLLRQNNVDGLTNEVTVLKDVEIESEEVILFLRNEVAVLKQAEADSAEAIAGLRGEIEAAEAKIKQLEETLESLGDSEN